MSKVKTFTPETLILLLVAPGRAVKLVKGITYTISKADGQIGGVNLSAKTITAAVHKLALKQQPEPVEAEGSTDDEATENG